MPNCYFYTFINADATEIPRKCNKASIGAEATDDIPIEQVAQTESEHKTNLPSEGKQNFSIDS